MQRKCPCSLPIFGFWVAISPSPALLRPLSLLIFHKSLHPVTEIQLCSFLGKLLQRSPINWPNAIWWRIYGRKLRAKGAWWRGWKLPSTATGIHTLLQEIKESLLKSTRTKLTIISKKNRILIAEKQGKSVNWKLRREKNNVEVRHFKPISWLADFL